MRRLVLGARRIRIATFRDLQNGIQVRNLAAWQRQYDWITVEAEELISKAYLRHKALADAGERFPPSLDAEHLEKFGKTVHFEPKTMGDKVAFQTVKVLEKLMELFFREKYMHHACTLETLASVPGFVAAMMRHMRSLRNMKRDHGWINPLLEEAENERMHLLIWMKHTQPTAIERFFVIFSQILYVSAYSLMYAASPKTAHRCVGYLEEAAVRAYNDFLAAIDSGEIENVLACKIGRQYYQLPDTARLRDLVLQVRADECMHRDFNHHLSNLHAQGKSDHHPITMTEDLAYMEMAKEEKNDHF